MPSIILFCATRRGLAVLEEVRKLSPGATLTAVSFREDPCEPVFMDDIRARAKALQADFLETRQTGTGELAPFWDAHPADIMLAVNWRYRIPPKVYRRARLGSFVFHDALLPAYRGFSPTVWAIANGETQCGATLFEIAEEIDSGPIVDQERVAIGPNDSIGDLFPRVTEAYLAILRRSLTALLAGNAPRTTQDELAATYVCKRVPDDNRIDWRLPAARVHNLVRAVTSPYPGAFSLLDGRKLTVWASRRAAGPRRFIGSIPGRVVEIRPGEGSVVLAGDGPLLVTEVQPEGGPRTCAAAVLDKLSMTLV